MNIILPQQLALSNVLIDIDLIINEFTRNQKKECNRGLINLTGKCKLFKYQITYIVFL